MALSQRLISQRLLSKSAPSGHKPLREYPSSILTSFIKLHRGSQKPMSQTYTLANSPFQESLEGMVKEIQQKYGQEADDSLYLAVTKRMSHRPYNNDDRAYLTGLISDVQSAKREFNEVCFDSDIAYIVFSTLKFAVMAEMVD